MITTDTEFVTQKYSYSCLCGKEYKHRQGLYGHQKKCSQLHQCNTSDQKREIKRKYDRERYLKVRVSKPEKNDTQPTRYRNRPTTYNTSSTKDECGKSIQEPINEMVAVLLEQNTMFQELILKNEERLRKTEEEKNELLRRTEEEQLRNEEDRRKTDGEKVELQKQMMDLQKQFLEAIKKGNKVITVES